MTKSKNPSPKFISILFLSALVLAIYCFWAFPYRAAMSYREEMQMFLTTSDYFYRLVCRPGGIATYIGEFLTQFFNNYWAGAAVMTALMISYLLLTSFIIKKFTSSRKYSCLALASVSLIALWLYLGNPDVLISFLVAIILPLSASCVFTVKGNYITLIIGTMLLYWLAGPTVIIFSCLAIAYRWKQQPDAVHANTIFSIVAIIWPSINFLAWLFFVSYPISYQLIGIGYLLKPDTLDAGQIAVEALCVAIPLISILVTKFNDKITVPIIAVIGIISIIICYPKSYDKITYRLIDYDYMVRANNWDGIINYSNKYEPDLPLSVSATNLALGMTGQLDSRAFSYFQHGAEGLVPPFLKETLSSWTSGEIFFQLGMVNSAQRFYFEGMEAIPNYNKSSRAIRRLAETAMIRGEYSLARKYLQLLENTVFYKKWARRNLELINSPGGVDSHPLYGRLRAAMIDEQYMFSEGELDKTFGQLFLKDNNNNLAKQYLIVYPLLQRNLNKFAEYMGVVAEAQSGYNPLLAQQVMAFMAMKNNQPIPPGAVQPGVEQSLRDFARAWTSKDPALIEPHRRSLFYYLLSQE